MVGTGLPLVLAWESDSPSCVPFQGGPYHDMLHSVLGAYTCYRPDVGYVSESHPSPLVGRGRRLCESLPFTPGRVLVPIYEVRKAGAEDAEGRAWPPVAAALGYCRAAVIYPDPDRGW